MFLCKWSNLMSILIYSVRSTTSIYLNTEFFSVFWNYHGALQSETVVGRGVRPGSVIFEKLMWKKEPHLSLLAYHTYSVGFYTFHANYWNVLVCPSLYTEASLKGHTQRLMVDRSARSLLPSAWNEICNISNIYWSC